MAIIVEDGSNVPGANSYASAEDLVLYAMDRNITIPDKQGDQEVLLVKAMDYLRLFAHRWIGRPTFDDQYLPWPRTNYRTDLGVPRDLKDAQLAAAVAAMTLELIPVQSGTQRLATRKTVGPITVQYENSGSRYGAPVLPFVASLLSGLFASGGAQVPVVRA